MKRALLTLAALLFAVGGAQACLSKGSPPEKRKGFGVMTARAQVIVRLDCSIGQVRFVSAEAGKTEILNCRSKPHIHHFTVVPGTYSLSFQDPLENRLWRSWQFAATTRRVNYWGDIHILPRLARVQRNRETEAAARGLTNLPVVYSVLEKHGSP